MIRKLRSEAKGFTLTEILFIVLLIAVLMMAVYPYLRATHTGWKTSDRRAEVIQNARVGMDWMVKMLREATGFTSVTAATDADGRIVFLNKDGNTIEFKKYNDGANDMLGYVDPDEATHAVAGPIEGLTFTCYEEDGVTATTAAEDIKSVKIELVVSDSEGEVDSQVIICRAFIRKDITTAVVISEIMYYPCNDVGGDKESQFEFIEVYNNGSTAVDLNGWHIEDSVRTDTDTISAYGGSSTSLPAGEYAVIGTSDTKIFNNLAIAADIKLKINDTKFGNDGLDNSGDSVILKKSNSRPIDSVSYESSWGGGYTQADSTGTSYSLERIDPSATSNDSANWGQNTSVTPNAVVTLGAGGNRVTVSFYCTPGAENSVSE